MMADASTAAPNFLASAENEAVAQVRSDSPKVALTMAKRRAIGFRIDVTGKRLVDGLTAHFEEVRANIVLLSSSKRSKPKDVFG